MKHVAPVLNQPAFHCPNCGVLSEQVWSANLHCHYTRSKPDGQNENGTFYPKPISLAMCQHCKNYSVW